MPGCGSAALLGSFRTWRDRAIAGLMLLSGLRSAEVLGLTVADVDIARSWIRVIGKGNKERWVPIDVDVVPGKPLVPSRWQATKQMMGLETAETGHGT